MRAKYRVDVVFENDVDHRKAERGLRSHDADPGKSLQVDGQRIGDLVLDLLRAVAGPVGEDDDLVVREVRDGVDRRGVSAHQPQAARLKYSDDQKTMRRENSRSRLIIFFFFFLKKKKT